MAKAPSEKHLEDWIVANHRAMGWQEEPVGDWNGFSPVFDKIIARQLRLPSGIADLIALSSLDQEISVTVVEIKRGEIDTKTLAQCLRYMRDLREIFYWARMEFGFNENWYPDTGIWGACHGMTPEITGIIIGDSMPDRNLGIACESSSIKPLVYDYLPETNTYTIDYPDWSEPYTGLERIRINKDFIRGAVGDAMRVVMNNRLDKYRWQVKRHE